MQFSIKATKRCRCYWIARGRVPENLIMDYLKIETKLWEQTLALSSVYIGKLSSLKMVGQQQQNFAY